MRSCLALPVGVMLNFSAPNLFAHVAPETLSEDLTEQVAANQMNAQLLLQRAESYRYSKNWESALADYAAAEKLGMGEDVSFYRARMYLDAGQSADSISEAKIFLKHHPNNAAVLVTLAYAYQLSGNTVAAIAMMQAALPELLAPTADYYIDLSEWYQKENNTQAALEILDAGNARLHGSTALQIRALELAAANDNFNDALYRLAALPENLRSQPAWLLRRGDLQRNSGNADKSIESYQLAQSALDSMAVIRRNRQVNQSIQQALSDRLATGVAP
ncbi:MAG: hypothetical protein P8R04_02455 [Gammaproteobacteria bacterium]|nr:hypothetical protein [Gammaproteobacteria bacterium]